MTDRTDEDAAAAPMFESTRLIPEDRQAEDRMRSACATLTAARGAGFRMGSDGELKVGAMSVALRHLQVESGVQTGAPQTSLLTVMPRPELHMARHALALQLNAHAMVVHGASLTSVADGTLVLLQPVDLRLHDTAALAAALGRFVDLAQGLQEGLGLGLGVGGLA